MNARPLKTVFLDYDTVSNGDLDLARLREASGNLILYEMSEAQTAERVRDADIVLLNKLELSRELLSGAPQLKLIAQAGTGTNHIDLIAARERGIAVCNVRAYCTASVVQHVWGLILSLTQHVDEFSRFSKDGSWASGRSSAVLSRPIRELQGRVFGVVGWGELGRGAARIAEAFGMRVIIADRPGAPPRADRVPLDEFLRTADIVSLHCPLSDATRGLIGARELELMKPDALLINTSRGALVDGTALAAALKAGQLGGAGIDVLPQEPPQEDEPLVDDQIPNLLVTPHIAWAAREARQRCIDEMAANIRDFRSGGRRGRVI
ncbi:MAG TPA: D-2-hydroxyacid dehydrogenase [Steroidobacteraceae bacterium]|jgi:glycerate dehydrogenase|nr:D-2-hydroxyacid dehydrogenase [Steroidobacteraceae bacterium]